jgi:hypothetical protein
MQTARDHGYARLPDLTVVFNIVLESVLFDKIGEFVFESPSEASPAFILFSLVLIVREDVIDAARTIRALLVAALQALELALYTVRS